MKDRELLVTLLQSGRLTPTQTEGLQGELARLDYGFAAAMSPPIRRHAEAIAKAKGLMPTDPPKKVDRSKRSEWCRADDPYSGKRTAGTAYAEGLLATRAPKRGEVILYPLPPQKRSA